LWFWDKVNKSMVLKEFEILKPIAMEKIKIHSYNKFRMIRNVLSNSPGLFADKPEAEATVQNYLANLTEIEGLMQQQQHSVKGFFANKQTFKTQLAETTFRMLNLGLMMASKTGNLALEVELRTQLQELRKNTDPGLYLIAKQTVALLQPLSANLAGFGVEEAGLLELNQQAEAYNQMREGPKTQQRERKVRKTRLNELFVEQNKLLKDQLDRFFRFLGPENADVASKYFYNRRRLTPITKPNGPDAQELSAEIAGTVTAQATGLPLPDVVISLLGRAESDITEEDGIYILGDLAAGSYTLQFSCFGYKDATLGPVDLTADATLTLNMALEKAP
jgi:hypothetical protein